MTAIVVSLIILIFYIRILYTEINVEGVAQVINLMLIVSEEVAHMDLLEERIVCQQ